MGLIVICIYSCSGSSPSPLYYRRPPALALGGITKDVSAPYTERRACSNDLILRERFGDENDLQRLLLAGCHFCRGAVGVPHRSKPSREDGPRSSAACRNCNYARIGFTILFCYDRHALVRLLFIPFGIVLIAMVHGLLTFTHGSSFDGGVYVSFGIVMSVLFGTPLGIVLVLVSWIAIKRQ
jgi:hypothetical protein